MPITLKDLFSSLNEYGMVIVILGIFLFIFIAIMINISKNMNNFISDSVANNDSYKDMILEQNKLMIEQLIKTKQELLENSPFEKDLMKTFNKLNNSLKDYCRDTMDHIGAERLAVYLFHNGSYSTHGIHFFKMSCICERVIVGSGVRERSLEHNSVPINLFDTLVEGLIDEGYYIISKTDENLEYSNHKIFFSASKITYIQAVAIFDNDNNIIGFVLAEMSNEYHENAAKKHRDTINHFISQIVPVLTYSEYKDMNMN